ncbi:hypothetical protein ACHAQJ_008971 [Trichoderma viride]
MLLQFYCAALVRDGNVPVLDTSIHLQSYSAELLQLLKGSGWTRLPVDIRTAVNKRFDEASLVELRGRFEQDRDTTISPSGQLAASNHNALTLPPRQTRRLTRAAVRRPLTEVSANIVLDTPAPKRLRLNTPEEVVPPTPTTLPRNALSRPEPPSMGPRRSSRLSSVQKVNHSTILDDATEEDSPDDVESEDSSDDDIDGMLDGFEDGDLLDQEDLDSGEDGPAATTAGIPESAIFTPFTDENGHLRIGPQPWPPAVHIKWVPKKEAIMRVRDYTHANYKSTEGKIKTSAPVSHNFEKAAIQDKILESLVEYGADSSKLTGTCDYTGVESSWAPGYQALSIEALYPFIVLGERIGYHASQNVGTVSKSLNWLKGKNMPIHLALLAALIRLQNMEIPLEERKGRMAWIFNALTNEAIFEALYHFRLSHQSQMDKWAKWAPAKQRDILEAARTGTRTNRISRDLASMQIEELVYLKGKDHMERELRLDG